MKYLVILSLCLFPSLVLCLTKEDEGTHYDMDENILMLDADNFSDTVLNSSTAWFIEFYSRWCGHCKIFAPTYRKLAKDVEDWQQVVQIAAVDCMSKSATGLDTGRRICFAKPFFIGGMPDFRFFPAGTTDKAFAGHKRKYEGTKVYDTSGKIVEDSDSLEKVRDKIISFLEENMSKNSSITLNTLKKKDLEEILSDGDQSFPFALIVEKKSSFVGRQVILDMSSFSGIKVFRIAETNKKVLGFLNETFGWEKTFTPTVLVVKDEESLQEFEIKNDDPRKFIREKLRALPGVKRSSEREEEEKNLGKQDERKNATGEELTGLLLDIDRSKVYMHDLEVAIHYTLRKEVSGVEYIRGRSLQALKDYLSLLEEYFPARPCVKKFLKVVNKTVKNLLVNQMLVWGTWQDLLERADESIDSYLTDNETYIGCGGSTPDFRGFPCSLWQLFHILVSEAYKFEPEGDWAISVVIAMQEYVARYFTCMECRVHWAAATKDIDKVSNSSEAVLYLWAKHNEVNERLAGGKTEDPEFPKIQWPSSELCPDCRGEEGEFIEKNVLKFLLEFYSKENISMDFVENPKSRRPLDEL